MYIYFAVYAVTASIIVAKHEVTNERLLVVLRWKNEHDLTETLNGSTKHEACRR
jgi:hypothetical protein